MNHCIIYSFTEYGLHNQVTGSVGAEEIAHSKKAVRDQW